MKNLLLLILFLPAAGYAQSFNKQFEGIKHPEIKTELYRTSRRLQTSGALIAVGGGFLATGTIISFNADSEGKRTTAKIIAGAGGLFCLIGGVMLSNAGESLFRSRNDKRSVAFNGSSIVVRF